jgi:DNA-binding NarL/FixJ family response regulator
MLPLSRSARALAATLDGSGAGPLTRREGEIAALVGRGLTNRQIAAALHISERTAENHVQHILTKLGLSTRTQIATWSLAQDR